MPASLAQRSGSFFNGSAHPVGNSARPSSEDHPAIASSTVSESTSSTPMTQAPCMKLGRKNTVRYTQSHRHWEERGSSCAIPRRSRIFIPRKHGHIFRPHSPSEPSQFSCVFVDDVRAVHVAYSWIKLGKGLLWSHGEDHKRYIHNLTRSQK
jgi:hypothetical protein